MFQKCFLKAARLLLALAVTAFAAAPAVGSFSPPSRAISTSSAGVITITPDQMSFTGEVVTHANCANPQTCAWINQSSPGAVILGMDPASSQPADWGGGSASLILPVLDYPNPTLLVLQISWPDGAGRGLHSPRLNQTAEIAWDGQPVWDMRTMYPGSYGDYYASEHVAVQTTLVITQPQTHILNISVPALTAWDIGQVTLTPYSLPPTLHGIGYSPYRDCQAPGSSDQPTPAEIRADLIRLAHSSNAVRTYASTGVNALVPSLAKSLGLRVAAGAWLNPGSADDAEIQGLLGLAQSTPIDLAVVGNEYVLRNPSAADVSYLAAKIDYVKNSLPPGVPVTTAEVADIIVTWSNGQYVLNPAYKPILDRVDQVMIHLYPFWEGKSVIGAARYAVNRYHQIQALIETAYPGQNKHLVIGETGWPSGGGTYGQAVPSLDNQRLYMQEFMVLAEQENVDYFYFDAFDELWKIEEPYNIGQHWGYSYTDRSAKQPEYGVLLPAARLPVQPSAQTASSDRMDEPPALSSPTRPAAGAILTVYDEWPGGADNFVPTGWMGDLDQISLSACDRSDPHSGELAIKASFSASGAQGWGGVYWQYPANNWGSLPQAKDLSQANKLTFWAKGAAGGERIRFVVGGLGGAQSPYSDSLRPAASSGFVELAATWQMYTIDLRGRDLSHIIGGFGWVTDRCANPNGAIFYLDDIQFAFDPAMPSPPPKVYTLQVYTDFGDPENHYTPSGFMDAAANPANIQLSECWLDNPHSGLTSIRVAYTHNPAPGQYGGGVYWLDPAENWGDVPGGLNLSRASSLSFWARSDSPGVSLKFLVGGVGYVIKNGITDCSQPTGSYPDSICPEIQRTFTLTSSWQRYTIDLLADRRALNHVVGGFGFYAQSSVTFYLDDIFYQLQPPPNAALTMPVDVAVDAQSGLAYVVNQAAGNVWILDASGVQKVITIPNSACPKITPYGACLNSVSVSPFNHKAYVSQWYADRLNIINGLNPAGWVYGGQGPGGIVTHPFEDTVYSLGKWASTITYIHQDKDLSRLYGSLPSAGCVNPLNQNAYIANTGNNTVSIIHQATLVTTLTVTSRPLAAVCAIDGAVYIVSTGLNPGRVEVITGTQVLASLPIGQGSTALGVSSYWGTRLDGSTNIAAVNNQTGQVFVSSWFSDKLSVIDHTVWITDVLTGHHPNAVGVFEPTNTVYVANTADGTVTVIRDLKVIATLPVGAYPIALAVNPTTGDVFVANRDDSSVTILHDSRVVRTILLQKYFLPLLGYSSP